jgi:hypothetical protein
MDHSQRTKKVIVRYLKSMSSTIEHLAPSIPLVTGFSASPPLASTPSLFSFVMRLSYLSSFGFSLSTAFEWHGEARELASSIARIAR